MVSQAKKKANGNNTPTLSPRRKSMRTKNVVKMKSVIELSSNVDTLMKADNNDNNSFRSPTTEPVPQNTEGKLEEKMSRFMELVLEGINNVTKIVASQSSLMSPASIHLEGNQWHTPTQFTQEKVGSQKTTANVDSCGKKTHPRHSKKDTVLNDDSLRKKLFTQTICGKGQPLLTSMEPLHNVMFDGMKTSVQIPKWIPMLFRPPEGLILDQLQSMVVAYLFGSNKDDNMNGKEVLVSTEADQLVDRNTLKTLLPRGMVDQEVLGLVATMLTMKERSFSVFPGCFYFPTTFAQYALGWSRSPEVVLPYYQTNYLGNMDLATKIFVPINDMKHHWFLLVVDLLEKKLIKLDSKPSPKKNAARRRYVRKLAIFLEEMMLDKSLYSDDTREEPEISGFQLVIPKNIGEQLPLTNDCGVWVAMWMIGCGFCDDYQIKVDDASRMKIAVDLILGSHNLMKDKVVQLASSNWKHFENMKKQLVVSS